MIQHEGPDENEEIPSSGRGKTHIWILTTIGKEARNAYINADTIARNDVAQNMMRLCADAGCRLFHPRREYYQFLNEGEPWEDYYLKTMLPQNVLRKGT